MMGQNTHDNFWGDQCHYNLRICSGNSLCPRKRILLRLHIIFIPICHFAMANCDITFTQYGLLFRRFIFYEDLHSLPTQELLSSGCYTKNLIVIYNLPMPSEVSSDTAEKTLFLKFFKMVLDSIFCN